MTCCERRKNGVHSKSACAHAALWVYLVLLLRSISVCENSIFHTHSLRPHALHIAFLHNLSGLCSQAEAGKIGEWSQRGCGKDAVLEEIPENVAYKDLRFGKEHTNELLTHLYILEVYWCRDSGYRMNGKAASIMLLYKLSGTKRDIGRRFGGISDECHE